MARLRAYPPPGCFWKKRLQPREKKGFASETQSHRGGGLESGVYPTPPGNADGYQNKGLAGKAIRKNMKTKGRPRESVVSSGQCVKSRSSADGCPARVFAVGFGGTWEMVAWGIRISKGVCIERSNFGVEW